MVARLGGSPVSAPAVAEVDVDAAPSVGMLAGELNAARDPIVVLLTGVAVARLFAVADRLGCATALTAALASATTVVRGPKPAGALSRRGITATHTVPSPFTTGDVVATLDRIAVEGRDVTVVHYGEPNAPIVECLAARGARVRELMLYEWRLPADVTPLSAAVDALVAGEIPVVAFTSQIQVRHLLDVAGPARRDTLLKAINDGVLVGAVGPTCAAACSAAGIASPVTPEHPKLAPLLQLLAATCAARLRRASAAASLETKERAR
jgi:uroporphyrinogen-III synthase